MEVDGKAIAADILETVAKDVKEIPKTLCLSVITCAPNFETKKYLEMKKQKAASVGVVLEVVELPESSTTKEVVVCVKKAAEETAGVVVQLPLPKQINSAEVLAAIPIDKDPDGFCYETDSQSCLPPVVGAIDEISQRHQIEWDSKKVVVLGKGRLVGSPAAHYARLQGSSVDVFTEETYDEKIIMSADIIISGIGKPHLIKASSVKEGAIVFDAGTSEDGGVLAGDISPEVADKASLITPVPGGVGPITIAYLLRNLVSLASQ